MRIDPSGKEAVTHYKTLERLNGFTLPKVFPKTGRTHQIRLHLKAIGHPLSVDPLYGKRSAIFLSSLKADYKPKVCRGESAFGAKGRPETPAISRLTLHAHRITFEPFPGMGRVIVEAPIPEDLERLIKLIRKYKASPQKDWQKSFYN